MKSTKRLTTPLRLPLMMMILMAGSLFTGLVLAEDGQIAESAQDVRPLLVGMDIPDVTYHAADGSEIALRELAAQRPMVLIYYRGGW